MHTNSYDLQNGRIYQVFNLRCTTGRGTNHQPVQGLSRTYSGIIELDYWGLQQTAARHGNESHGYRQMDQSQAEWEVQNKPQALEKKQIQGTRWRSWGGQMSSKEAMNHAHQRL